jgi:hypothetical protein
VSSSFSKLANSLRLEASKVLGKHYTLCTNLLLGSLSLVNQMSYLVSVLLFLIDALLKFQLLGIELLHPLRVLLSVCFQISKLVVKAPDLLWVI